MFISRIRSGVPPVLWMIVLTAFLLALACGPASPSGQQAQPPLTGDSSDDEIRAAVEKYAEDKRFDFAARITVGPVTELSVPVDDIDWSPYLKVEFHTVWRHTVEVVEVYDGDAPDSFVIITDNRIPEKSLDPAGEYVMFVTKAYAPREELDEEFRRWYFNESQLNAIGGEAWIYHSRQVWIVDGEGAQQVPGDYLFRGTLGTGGSRPDSHLDAARQHGVSLSLTDLKTAIVTGAARSASSPRVPKLVVAPAEPPEPTAKPPLEERLAKMQREAAARRAAQPPAKPTPAPLPRTEEELKKNLLWNPSHEKVGAILRVRVEDSRQVTLPEDVHAGLYSVRAGEVTPESLREWQRHTVSVVEPYLGSTPAEIDVLAPLHLKFALGGDIYLVPALQPGREYVLFLTKTYVHQDNPTTERFQVRLDDGELEAFGGEGYVYDSDRLWIVDGTDALHLSRRLIQEQEQEQESDQWDHLAVARARNERLPLLIVRMVATHSPFVTRFSNRSEDELRQAVRRMVDQRKYDGVAHLRVLSYRDVAVDPEAYWPDAPHHRPLSKVWRRARVEVVELFHGELPDEFDIVNNFQSQLPTRSLNVEREYILFLTKKWLLEGELVDSRQRRHYNWEQLDALGGEGYAYEMRQAWIIDGDTARLVPRDPTPHRPITRTQLDLARLGKENMPVATLKEVIGSSVTPDCAN